MAHSHVRQNSQPRSYEEKRSFPRMDMNCAMSFATGGEPAASEGHCKNLSAQGVLFSAGKPVQVGALVNINITPEKTVVAPFNAVVQVLRVSAAANANVYEIAARIMQMK